MADKKTEKEESINKSFSRRKFIKTTAAATAAFTIIPSVAMGKKLGHQAPSDTLNVALIGSGNQGSGDITSICKVEVSSSQRNPFGMASKPGTERLVAVCDVDWGYGPVQGTFEKFPSAKKYKDWRKMYDEMGKSIDAVVVATADHNHANPTATAITMGKHVYTEKPLTHSIYESRLLTKLAKKYGVATQMGNQGSSGEGVRQAVAWAWAGEIGEVRKADVWTSRPIWPQGLDTPAEAMKVPKTLDWDLFIAHMPFMPYNSAYHPWNFRGWWNFGTGAFGDMACHNMHPVFKVLNLGYPTQVQGQSTTLKKDACPHAQIVKMIFPSRPNLPNMAMPEVEVTWYDGGFHAMIPDTLPQGKQWQGEGCALYGTKDTLVLGSHGSNPYLLSGRTPSSPEILRVVPDNNHYLDWVAACKDPDLRDKTASHFGEAGPFNEMVLMGILAVRLQKLNRILDWDGPNMTFTNIADDEKVSTWSEMFDIGKMMAAANASAKSAGGAGKGAQRPAMPGMPGFEDPSAKNVKEFMSSLIKHEYLNGFKLPDMPA
ncbi:MAG TPA: Gfo/Idh/MocA family oxidoreductase [Bacteroidales bacterium]|nr:Gfo/Idh/MocA family oxidoreductase [Bacteroidales bacterium]